MTCNFCRGSGVFYGISQPSGTVCPACGGTGAVGATVSAPAEKTLLDEFAKVYSKVYITEYVNTMHHWPSIDERLHMSEMSYDLAAAMMRERNRRDETGNVKEVEG